MNGLPEPTDAAEQRVIEDIGRHGWHVVAVRPLADGAQLVLPAHTPTAATAAYESGFAYTVGLGPTYGRPELILVGGWAHEIAILNIAGELLSRDESITAGSRSSDILERFEVRFNAVDPEVSARCLTLAAWVSRTNAAPALQLLLPDEAGRWPGDAAYASKSQPLLAERERRARST